MTAWKHKQIASTIELTDLEATTIKAHVNAAYEQITRDLNISMFGDWVPPCPLTRMERLRRRFNIYWTRAHDAWLVLTGQADIGGDW